MTSVIMVFFLTRKCGQFSNDLLTFLTKEKQMKSNSSFKNSHTQIKVLEIFFEKKNLQIILGSMSIQIYTTDSFYVVSHTITNG